MIRFTRFIFFLFFSVVLWSGCSGAQGFFDHPLIGKAAPDFVLDTLDAKAVHLSDVSKGKKTILFFWATWCPHCRDQIKAFKQYQAELQKEGVVVLLVDIGEGPAAVRKFMASGGYDLPVFLDVDSYVAEMYEVFGVPTLFFIGPDGKILDMQNGLPDDFEQIFS